MSSVICLILIAITALLFFIKYQKITKRLFQSNKRLDGKTVIVTGGTAGIGLIVATDLAERGAKVIIACPFEDEGCNAEAQIIKKTGNPEVYFKLLDLASLDSVRKFASDILNTEHRLDILFNNAGVGIPADIHTKDGLNFIMQVNYYGTFLLTLLLLPLLKKTGKVDEHSRILNTTSMLHMIGQVNLDKANEVNYWYKVQIYGNSKLYLIYFANELKNQIKNSNVVINNIDPGLVGTRIYESSNKIIGIILAVAINIFFNTPWEGAQTSIYAAVDKNAGMVSGGYFKNCMPSRAIERAYDKKITKAIWKDSVRLVKLTDDELKHCLL